MLGIMPAIQKKLSEGAGTMGTNTALAVGAVTNLFTAAKLSHPWTLSRQTYRETSTVQNTAQLPRQDRNSLKVKAYQMLAFCDLTLC
jgi:hypothetical protein